MNRHRIFLPLVFLTLSTLACSIFVGGPDYPPEHIPVSAEAVQNLNTQIEAALIAGAETGTVTLKITEEQLTSFVAIKQSTQEEPAFANPQVFLREGRMKIYGTVERGYLVTNILIEVSVQVDDSGQPKIEISNADFGPFPAPDGLKQSMTAIITEAYTGSLGPVATGFRLETVTIAEGVMTVTGQVK